MSRRSRATRALFVTLCLLAGGDSLFAGTASAGGPPGDIVASTVTSNGFGTHYLYTSSLPNPTTHPANVRTVSGTAEGPVGAQIDVGCLRGAQWTSIGTTTLGAGSAWTVDGVLWNAQAGPCALRAVPSSRPSDLSPFQAAPPTTVNWFEASTSTWGLDTSRKRGEVSIDSAGDCGICAMKWVDAAGTKSSILWEAASWSGGSYALDPDGAGSAPAETQFHITVDGVRAHLPDGARFGSSRPGFVPVTASATLDPVTGTARVVATEALMTCVPGCSTNVTDTGVRLERTTTVDGEGQVVRFVDVIRNTGATSRALKIAYQASVSNSSQGMQLPGDADFSRRVNQVVPLTPAPVATVLAKRTHSSAGGTLTNPLGAIVASPSPDDVLFATDGDPQLRYGFTLPAGGSKTIRQTYVVGGDAADVELLADEAEQRALPPVLAIDAPADGTTVATATAAVSGTLSASVTSLKVNGTPVTVTDGKWSTTVPLMEGVNTISAVARDADGGETTASRKVTYAPKKQDPPAEQPAKKADPPPAFVAPFVPAGPAPQAKTATAGDPKTAFKNGIATVATGLTVGCPAGGPACTVDVVAKAPLPRSGKAKGKARGRVVIGRASLSVPPGATLPVKLGLTRTGSRALKRAGSLRVLVTMLTRVGAGKPVESNTVLRVTAG